MIYMAISVNFWERVAVNWTVHSGKTLFSESESLLSFLKSQGLEVIDKRPYNGALWVVGGNELQHLMIQLKKAGVNFVFTDRGGRASRHRPAWYTTSRK
jgi:predicted peroxiredoxin